MVHPDFHSAFSFSTVPMNPVSTHGAYIRQKKLTQSTFKPPRMTTRSICVERELKQPRHRWMPKWQYTNISIPRAVFDMLTSEIVVLGIRSTGKGLVVLVTFSKLGFLPSPKRFWSKLYSFSTVWGYQGRTGVCSRRKP